ncbi:hypothetical protein PanWU01x14_079040 [Parasponia andersonii]|uniref:Uncharacterized protein n=1 Tax=Parasponia andersonii TaxID=3476 RepID=A0A2P5DB97_PARAD|nr:hypothetical protein PanWU01x14_079040 [Parasponia andersonii]
MKSLISLAVESTAEQGLGLIMELMATRDSDSISSKVHPNSIANLMPSLRATCSQTSTSPPPYKEIKCPANKNRSTMDPILYHHRQNLSPFLTAASVVPR